MGPLRHAPPRLRRVPRHCRSNPVLQTQDLRQGPPPPFQGWFAGIVRLAASLAPSAVCVAAQPHSRVWPSCSTARALLRGIQVVRSSRRPKPGECGRKRQTSLSRRNRRVQPSRRRLALCPGRRHARRPLEHLQAVVLVRVTGSAGSRLSRTASAALLSKPTRWPLQVRRKGRLAAVPSCSRLERHSGSGWPRSERKRCRMGSRTTRSSGFAPVPGALISSMRCHHAGEVLFVG